MKERVVGLDLCRILSMLGIVILHVVGQGGAQPTAYGAQYWVMEILYICALCSVDVFALMSGYLGIGSKKATVYRAMELISIVVFFSAIATGCMFVLAPEKVSGVKALIYGVFPQLDGRYWYITNFIPVMLLQPYLNKMLLRLTEKQHIRLSLLCVALFAVIPTAIPVDFFRFRNGYSFAWLLCLYIVGAALKRSKLDTLQIRKRYLLLGFVGITGVLLAGNIFVESVLGRNVRYCVQYTSPFTLCMALCAFLLMKNLKMRYGKKLLETLSSVAFDVYIIHSHIYMFDILLAGAFAWITKESIWLCLPLTLAVSAGIYAVCAVLGIVRTKLFALTRYNVLMTKCSRSLDRFLYVDDSPQQ